MLTAARDLIVIGAGSAGLSAAGVAARLGARVALVESKRVGGDCTWTGCVPSKTLIACAGLAHRMRRADTFGLPPIESTVDLHAVMDRVRAVIERVYRFERPELLERAGIEVIHDTARFLDARRISAGGRVVEGRRLVICTGASPLIPDIPGLLDVRYHTYETIFELDVLPRSLVVLGAGPIGLELAQAFSRLGSRVTIIDQADRILPEADPEVSPLLARRLQDEGIAIATGISVERIASRGDSVLVSAGGIEHVAEELLVAVGRRPNTAELNVAAAGVALDRGGGIVVDHRLRSSRKHIYAAGDVTGSFQFTHYAGWQGYVAARNAVLPGWTRGIPPHVPWAVFTDPEVSHVGLSEPEARRRGIDIAVERWPVSRIDRAQTIGDDAGFVKLVTSRNGRLLGGTIVAAHASELVNELSLALTHGLTLRDLAAALHVYPTYGIALQQMAAAAAIGRFAGSWGGTLFRAFSRAARRLGSAK